MALYFIEFIVLSFAGWVYECTYCSFQTGKWQNRGFLYGPLCPIYGAGAVAAIVIAHYLPGVFSADTPPLRVFLIAALGSAVLEFGTSWVLEKLFHARWWDYSDLPLNIQGRICVPATTLFGLAGLAIVKLLLPLETELASQSIPLLNELCSLVLCFALGVDTGLTVDSLMKLGERMDLMQQEFDQTMERRFEQLRSAPAALTAQVRDAEQELAAVVSRNQKRLSARQRYLLRNVIYRAPERTAMSERLRTGLLGVHKRLDEFRKEYQEFQDEYNSVDWERTASAGNLPAGLSPDDREN